MAPEQRLQQTCWGGARPAVAAGILGCNRAARWADGHPHAWFRPVPAREPSDCVPFTVPQVWHIRQEDGKGKSKGVWSMDYAEE